MRDSTDRTDAEVIIVHKRCPESTQMRLRRIHGLRVIPTPYAPEGEAFKMKTTWPLFAFPDLTARGWRGVINVDSVGGFSAPIWAVTASTQRIARGA